MENFKLIEEPFGKINGEDITKYTLIHPDTSFKVSVINYGAIIQSIQCYNINQQLTETVLGFDQLEDYVLDQHYIGSAVGRYANRIANASFSIKEQHYHIDTNWNQHHLHGGSSNFGKKIWMLKNKRFNKSEASVTLEYESKNGEGGFPGNIKTTLTFSINTNNELHLVFFTTTDQATPLSLTHHSYFNLNNNHNHNIENLKLQLYAKQFLKTDELLIPTGELISVTNTPYDFTTPKPLSEALKNTLGIDKSYIVADTDCNLSFCAQLLNEENGIALNVFSDLPGLQLYTGNYLQHIKGRNNTRYNAHQGICLEPQYHPNSPNTPEFPSTIITPNEPYHHHIIYRFTIEKN